MKNVNVRKLALAGILVAVGIVCSPLSIPVGASRCAPIQHFINILGGVFLGPWYAVGMAFVTSLLRNLMGTGTLLAFPGSMCGALICGLLYRYTQKLPLAYLGELFGTSVIGGVLSYPVSVLLMGNSCAVFAFVLPFLYIQLWWDSYCHSTGDGPEAYENTGYLPGKTRKGEKKFSKLAGFSPVTVLLFWYGYIFHFRFRNRIWQDPGFLSWFSGLELIIFLFFIENG